MDWAVNMKLAISEFPTERIESTLLKRLTRDILAFSFILCHEVWVVAKSIG